MSLLTDLVSYWKLDESSGNALDAHGSNDLTDNNTVGTAAGKIGNARDAELSDNEYFSCASTADLQAGDRDFTFAGWIKFESLGGTNQSVLQKYSVGNVEFFLYWDGADGVLRWGVSADGTFGAWYTVQTSAIANTWYFFTVWHDATNNEIALAINAGTPVMASVPSGVFAGSGDFVLSQIDGLLDEFGRWNRMLTSQERTDLYNSGAGLPYSSFGGASGAIDGSCDITITGSAALTGTGALTGTASIAFGQSAALSGDGALAALSSLTMAGSAVLTGAGSLAGTASIGLSGSGSITAPGELLGSAALSAGAAAAITGTGALAGSADLTVATTAVAAGSGELAGATSLSCAGIATLVGAGALAAAASMQLAAMGTLADDEPPTIVTPTVFYRLEGPQSAPYELAGVGPSSYRLAGPQSAPFELECLA